jgi:type I restriction enzyme, S subunit
MLMSDWKQYTIGQCCEILDSQRIPLNSEVREKRVGNIPYYGANGIQGYIDDFIFDEDLMLLAEDGGNFEQYAIRPIAYRISGKSWVNNHAHVLRAKDGFNQDFIYFSLVHKNVLPFIVGGTRSKLNQAELRNVTIDIPDSYQEQAQIADVINTIDKAIEQTQAIIEKQTRIKNGLMQDLLTRGIDAHGKIRSEETHPFKDSPLGRIPVEWEVDTLARWTVSSAFGPRFPSKAYRENGNIAILRTTDMDDEGEISYETMPLAQLNENVFHSHILQEMDLLISRSGTIGIAGLYSVHEIPVLPGAFLIRLRLDQQALNPYFLRYYFNWENGRRRVLHLAEGGVQKNLRGSTLLQMQLAFPSIEEQGRILRTLDALSVLIRTEQSKQAKLRLTKTALMQDLLTGKVRVTDLLNRTAPPTGDPQCPDPTEPPTPSS